MKKIKALALALALIVTTFGCSEDSDTNSTNSSNINQTTNQNSTLLSKDEPITVTFWHYYGQYVQDKLNLIVDEFNKTIGAENGVKVETIAKPSISDLEVEISESAQGVVYADSMPSMFLAYADKVLELQELGVISDLDEFFSVDDKTVIIESFLNSGIINDVQTMLPVVKSTELVLLNQTNWNEFAGETGYTHENMETWEGLHEVAVAYYEHTDAKTPDILNDGKALFGFDSMQNFIIVSSMQMGVDIFNEKDDIIVINSDIFEKIFKYYIENMAMGYFASNGKFRTDDVRSGDIIAYAGSSASFVYFPNWIEENGKGKDIEWIPLQYPYFDGEIPKVLSQGAGVAVSKISDKQQEACALFLKFFLEFNLDFAIDTAYIPVVSEFLEATDEEMLEVFSKYELEENGIQAYNLVIEQIEDERLYQAVAFEGSYIFRSEVAEIFEEAGKTIVKLADEKIANGILRENLLDELKIDEYFNTTMETLKERLTSRGVNFRYE